MSTRCMLAFGGILAAGLGIVGLHGAAQRLRSQVKFVDIVGVVPFLIIGELCFCCILYVSVSVCLLS